MYHTLPALSPDQVPVFLRAIQHNRETIKRQLAERRLVADDYYFVTLNGESLELESPGQHSMNTCRAVNDYIAGALVGALPFLELHGSDGIRVDEAGDLKQVELKLCMKSSMRYTITLSGKLATLKSAPTSSPVNYRNDCAAHYEIINNQENKRIDTFLVLFDEVAWQLIDIYKMPGEMIINLLGTNQLNGKEKTSRKRSVSLTSFMTNGQRVYLDFIDSTGVKNWEDAVYARCGRDPKEAEGYWNDERQAHLEKLWTTGVKLDKILLEFPSKTKKAIQSKAKQLGIYRP